MFWRMLSYVSNFRCATGHTLKGTLRIGTTRKGCRQLSEFWNVQLTEAFSGKDQICPSGEDTSFRHPGAPDGSKLLVKSKDVCTGTVVDVIKDAAINRVSGWFERAERFLGFRNIDNFEKNIDLMVFIESTETIALNLIEFDLAGTTAPRLLDLSTLGCGANRGC